jgi:fibronectin type 3 domain-containing protein
MPWTRVLSARLAVLATSGLLLAALLPFASVSAGTLNTAVLDNGTCGHNLQLGSDVTASSSATPWFLLYGDGGAASYAMFIDGVSIGTYKTTDVYGDVCINDPLVLADGAHVLTGNELAPHSTYTVTPFSFSVDTVPPAAPSTPYLQPNGGNTTTATQPSFSGTSDPNVAIRLYAGVTRIGGARASSSGTWYVTTISLSPGSYTVYAVAADEANNVSAASGSLSLTITSSSATVPGAPTLTSATAGNASVALAWSAPASNGGSAITGYRIYRSTASGSETLYTSVGLVTGYTDTGVTNGTTYYYKVAAVNSVGTGSLSNELSAKPQSTATVPGAPTLTSATAGNASVALAWSAPASNGGSAITGYRIYRSTASETLYTSVGLVTGYTDTGVTNGTTYYYKVAAVNAIGMGSLSNELSAKPQSVPSAPLNVAANANKPHGITLSWSPPTSNGGSSITGYRIYRGTSSGAEILLTTVAPVTGFTDTGTNRGVTYYYKVSAVNAIGESVLSAEASTVAR